ncbi:c-type cytochrome biogenesis protein CcmI [Lichenibacterium minor]|uniref:C-type cytochrome biogenesis protein CcmI n=1 Tax=Lichenibacterium minor TaxID=2316528 RepID=A0A4Q2U5C4_9HYPH|nr:c-type cytochrome biogenesis protein CcmI [Lichenibacterium minor]RYC31510.1 c-type cytochrome biogenesis protein CcmI [Lichenibacterium minor]
MVWLAFAFMAAAAVLCVSWPLLRPREAAAEGATDTAFYRDQLRELASDVDRGILRPADVAATRAELGRRLIQASETTGRAPGAPRRRVATAAAAGALVVAVAAGLYAEVGHPGQPDAPLAARETGQTDFATAIAKIEAHLASDPNDGRGLEIMAPVYMKMGRFDDAVRTYRDIIRVRGRSPSREAELGQALVMQADGVVTGDARQVFDAALKDDPVLPQARFFEGLASLQDGDKAKARATWEALIREAPPEAPYTKIVRERVAELDGAPARGGAAVARATGPAPDPAGAAARGPLPGMPAGAAAIASLPAGQQQAAIRGMVDGLAARLAENGQDGAGWLRLVRAYRVLGEQDKAVKALADARRALAGDPQATGELDRLAHELGLES